MSAVRSGITSGVTLFNSGLTCLEFSLGLTISFGEESFVVSLLSLSEGFFYFIVQWRIQDVVLVGEEWDMAMGGDEQQVQQGLLSGFHESLFRRLLGARRGCDANHQPHSN